MTQCATQVLVLLLTNSHLQQVRTNVYESFRNVQARYRSNNNMPSTIELKSSIAKRNNTIMA